MKVSEIKSAKNYELITYISRFFAQTKIYKGLQKETIRMIEELADRGVIEDPNEFIRMNRWMFDLTILPDKYKIYMEK